MCELLYETSEHGLGGNWPADNPRLGRFPIENLGEHFCVNIPSRDDADYLAASRLAR